MKVSLNSWDYINIIFLVVTNILVTDILQSDALKSLLAIAPFLILLFIYYFKNKESFYKVFIIYLFSFPFSPRDIVSYQLKEATVSFISFINFNIGFLSLSLFTIIFFTILEVINLGLLSKMIKYFVLFILSYACYSLLMNVSDFYLNFFVSDLKPFLIFFFGYFFGLCVYKRFSAIWNYIFFNIISILLIVFFIKTIFYIVYDLFFVSFNTSFGTLPYLFVPILFLSFYSTELKKKNIFILMALVASFNLSRGFFLMLGVFYLLLPLFYSTSKNIKKVFFSYVILSGLLTLMFSFSKLFLSSDINQFLEYKLNFFTSELFSEQQELNRSAMIRVYEFKNITYEIFQSPLKLFFGKGMGGYFEFKEYMSPIAIEIDAFSQNQLDLNKYFRPHTFFNMSLLKGGVFLFFAYSYKNIKVFLYSIKLYKKNKGDMFIIFGGIFSLLYLFFYWIPEFVFLNGLTIGYVAKHRKNII